MSKDFRFSCGAWAFTSGSDRFVPGGYAPGAELRQQLRQAATVPDLMAVEIQYPTQFEGITPQEINQACKDNSLEISCILVNNFSDPIYQHGAFTSGEPEVREQALKEAKEAIDVANQLGCRTVGLWPGQDGYDYPFQADYRRIWDLEISAIKEIAEHDPQMRIAVEYKLKEPRTTMLIGSVGKGLMLIEEVGLPNVGITIDTGHALMGKETPGESVVLAARKRRLFGVHFNDNYSEWDDDLIVGSVNIWQNLEFLYWVMQVSYDGYITLDIYPNREGGVAAASMSIRNIKAMAEMLKCFDWAKLTEAQKRMRANETLEIVRPAVYSA
jgi:xylose isomerase